MTDHDAASLSGQPHRTLHLVPEEHWLGGEGSEHYHPERFADEGFIHTTLGDENVLDVANRYYQGDPRQHLVLEVEIGRLTSPWQFDEAGPLYPHIYGPLNRDAVVGVRKVLRDEHGKFVGFSPYP